MTRLPLSVVCLFVAVLLALPVFSAAPAAGQTPSSPPASGQSGTPATPGQPGGQPSGPASTPTTPALGPDGRPYVPPSPPPPSQTRIPGAFDMSLIPLDAPRLSFSSTVSLSEEYSDNFHLTERGRVENFRTSLSASGTATLNYPNTQGSLTTRLSGAHDSAAPDDDSYSFFPSFTGTLQHTFNPRMRLVVSDTFVREDDPWLSDSTGLRGERDTFSKNTFSISFSWLIDIVQTQVYYRNSLFFGDEQTMSHIFGATASMPVGALYAVSGGYEFTTRDTTGDDTGDFSGQTFAHRVFGSVSRSLGTFTSVGVSSSFTWIDSETDSRIGNISLFAAHGVPGGFSVSGSVGYSVFDSDGAEDLNHRFSANIVASYRFARATISAGYSQDFRQTADEGEDFGLVFSRTAFVAFSYAITPFVTATARGQYSESEAVEGGDSGIAPQKTYRAGASISWRILTWLSLTGAYTYTKRDVDSNASVNTTGRAGENPERNNQSSTENRATVTLTAHF